MSQPNNRLVSFQGLNEVTTSSGSIFISPKSQKSILVLRNLQSLSGQQVYRLWAVSQGKKTGCANFTPDEQGKVYLELSNEALSEASLLLITIEPKANTPQHFIEDAKQVAGLERDLLILVGHLILLAAYPNGVLNKSTNSRGSSQKSVSVSNTRL